MKLLHKLPIVDPTFNDDVNLNDPHGA